jgi:hypothetical protein
MDNEPKYTLKDLVTLSADQKPIEFEDAFNYLLADRIQNAVDNKKLEVAQSMFNKEEEYGETA